MNRSPDRSPPRLPDLALYPLFFVAVYLAHFTLLRLPYFWDEAGYYIPAAWDFFRTGTLVPYTTLSNAHPPLPSILLAGWWRLSGYVPSGTRTFICIVAAFALLAVFRIARTLTGSALTAAATALLTALYPVWFAQSTLAHADIFAAAFTLWALAFFLPSLTLPQPSRWIHPTVALLFSLAALSKETAIVIPIALAIWAFILGRRTPMLRPSFYRWTLALSFPVIPLLAWYAYHRAKTGYIFGNPEFLRYNATATLGPFRILLALWHRIVHLTFHMNMWVPLACTLAVLLMPRLPGNLSLSPLPRRAIYIILIVSLFEFTFLGGALLTRYLLPLYPLLLLLFIDAWRSHLRRWWPLALLTACGFLAALFINPPYAFFAPEDNLTYRDMIVLHQQAAQYIATHCPQATVLTAWPATSELMRPDLGYVTTPIHTAPLENFAIDQIERAALNPGEFDTALLFSTKYDLSITDPPLTRINRLSSHYFDDHRDLHPDEVARILHGQVVWQAHRRGEWAAVLRFPRSAIAQYTLPANIQANHL